MNQTTNQSQPNTSSGNSRRTLSGMFSDRESAENAYKTLSARGYTKDEIHVIMSDKTRDTHFKHGVETELGNKALEGTGTGSAIGGTLGAIIGAVAAIGTNLIIPGLGLVIAGPLAVGLAGAGAGAIAGGLVGALIGMGIPEEHAKRYEDGIKKGNIVMGVHPRNDEDSDFIEKEWRTYKGENIYR